MTDVFRFDETKKQQFIREITQKLDAYLSSPEALLIIREEIESAREHGFEDQSELVLKTLLIMGFAKKVLFSDLANMEHSPDCPMHSSSCEYGDVIPINTTMEKSRKD